MKTRLLTTSVLLVSVVLAAGPSRADVLVRMNETSLKGTYKGGTDAAMMFETGGQVQQIPGGEVFCILFSPRPAGTEPATGGAPSGTGPTTLLRKNGSVLKGLFKGGTDAALLFEVGGQVVQVDLGDVLLVMNDRPALVATAATPATPAPAGAVVSGVVPAGTKLMITLTQDVTTATHPTGAAVEGVLAVPLTIGAGVVAPEGTKVFGKVLESRGGKVVGGSYITLSFTSIQIGNNMVPIETSEVGAEAGKGGTAKKVGAGALIGAAAGDAGAGAAVGGAVAILSSGKNHLRIPKGTKAEVSLKQDVKIAG